MNHIVCLKWGTKFSADYVNNLYSAIKRHTSEEFRLHCYTDNARDILPNVKVHKLPELNLTGWWYKLWLFSNEINIPEGEKIMFFDLDTLVTGPIDHILQFDPADKMVGLQNFYHPTRFASGLLMWTHGCHNHIWQKFIENPQKAINSTSDGDQEWTERHVVDPLRFQQLFPNCIYSYKQSCSQGLPADASIVCYHGTPSITQSYSETVRNYDGVWEPQQWVLEHWRTP